MKKIIIICCLIACGYTQKNNSAYKDAHINRMRAIDEMTYEIVRDGSGECPIDGQTVSIYYIMWIDNDGVPGLEIDNSYNRKIPFTFMLGRNIMDLWEPTIKKMTTGSIYRLYIPHSLGYGKRGIPGKIPSSANLIVDIELVRIQ